MTHKYTVQSTTRIGDILLLTLAPKKLGRSLAFTPGQYATIGFTRNGRPTPMRSFSIVSTPRTGVLQFAMRVAGDFTQAASTLEVGETVRVQGPFGEFTIDEQYDRRVVMLAGGIGITPFMSMLRDATERKSALPITLLYSNRSAVAIPFYEELKSLESRNPRLRVYFYSGETTAAAAASGVRQGRITEGHIEQLTDTNYANATYFLCGSKQLIDTLQARLINNGVHETRVVSESFSQATKQMVTSRYSIRSLTYGLTAATLVLATGFIMALDLSRTVPRLASAQGITSNQATAQTTTPATSSSNNSNNSTSPTSSDSTTTTPNATTVMPQTNYQQPVSSVS